MNATQEIFDQQIEALYAASPNTDFLVISRGIDRPLHADLTACLERRISKNENCHIFLTTYGGDPHGGYRVARCLRHHYSRVRLIVPSFCKSAGTMIAIVADELAIGDLGELGPLDIQVTKPNEFQERSSGLDIMQALYACLEQAQTSFSENFLLMRQRLRLPTRQAGELAAQLSTGLLAPLYAQIDPLRIGELQRATSITLQYGIRLNAHSNNLRGGDALSRLVTGYPAHGFVIDRKEAKELFHAVLPLSSEEKAVTSTLWPELKGESKTGPYFLNRSMKESKSDDSKQEKSSNARTKSAGSRKDSARSVDSNAAKSGQTRSRTG
jgi:Serine dehydrogenase proteinase